MADMEYKALIKCKQLRSPGLDPLQLLKRFWEFN
jgi:hypothetical protein